jgi:hypothetical protein
VTPRIRREEPAVDESATPRCSGLDEDDPTLEPAGLGELAPPGRTLPREQNARPQTRRRPRAPDGEGGTRPTSTDRTPRRASQARGAVLRHGTNGRPNRQRTQTAPAASSPRRGARSGRCTRREDLRVRAPTRIQGRGDEPPPQTTDQYGRWMWHVCPFPGKPPRRGADGSGPHRRLRPLTGRRAGRVEDPASFGRQDTSRRRPAGTASPRPQPGQPTRLAERGSHGAQAEARGTDRPRTPRCSPPRATAEGTDHAGNCQASAALERMQSPREYRAALRRQRRSTATDSSADQGLEVGRRGRQTGNTPTLVEGAGPAREPGINGEKATTGVNWTSAARKRRTRRAETEATRRKPGAEGAETPRNQVTGECCGRGKHSEGWSATGKGPGPSEDPDVAEPRQAGFFGASPAHSSEAAGRRRHPLAGSRNPTTRTDAAPGRKKSASRTQT